MVSGCYLPTSYTASVSKDEAGGFFRLQGWLDSRSTHARRNSRRRNNGRHLVSANNDTCKKNGDPGPKNKSFPANGAFNGCKSLYSSFFALVKENQFLYIYIFLVDTVTSPKLDVSFCWRKSFRLIPLFSIWKGHFLCTLLCKSVSPRNLLNTILF